MEISNVLVIAFIFLLGATRSSASQELATCRFNAIYQFGDSLSDTGNAIVESPEMGYQYLPYGISINKATGRYSDGLLMIDYIAQSAGLPLLDPYEKRSQGANFTQGVNFAVSGQTASDVAFLKTVNIDATKFYIKNTLNVQLGWFDAFLNSICGKDEGNCDRKQKLKSALFMLGTIGTNDYNYALLSFPFRMSSEEGKKAIVSNVINVIVNATKTLIDRGAVRVVVPGIFPFGCAPLSLKIHGPQDEYGCVKATNELVVYHNANLEKALENLRKEYPAVRIVYGDLYNAYLYVHKNSAKLGFRELTKACCGAGGEFNVQVGCKDKENGRTVCENRNEYISWDGIHLTQQTYKYMAEWLIRDIFPKLGC